MPKVIWTGQVFYDGQNRTGRVVRDDDQGDLVFEVEWGHAAMGETIWKRSEEVRTQAPFREFLIAAGNLMMAAEIALGKPRDSGIR